MRRLLLAALVLFHLFIVLGNTTAFFVLPFWERWWISIPLCSFILWVSFSPGAGCPLTRLENTLRRSMGMPRIGGFIGHYFMGPLKRVLRKGGE
jgi:hypothetical protein